MTQFGKAIMSKDFMLDPHKAFLNHGSFGAAPRCVLQRRIQLIEEQERQPDIWFRKLLNGMWKENVEVAAEFLGSKPENLAFVSNTTTAINAVIRSLSLKEGDSVLLNMYSFGAVKNTCHFLSQKQGFNVVVVEYPYPLLDVGQLLTAYETAFCTHSNIRLAIIDYISCMPPMMLPVNELVAMCRRHDCLVFVDGANTPGQLRLQLETLGADFYAGNLHKWAFAARGCAVLWVSPDHQRTIFPTVTSRYDVIDWRQNFGYQGTNDNTQFYTAKAAIAYFREIGNFDGISQYNKHLVAEAADLLVATWKTEHYPLPEEMKTPYMRVVRLPVLEKYTVNYQRPQRKHDSIYLTELMFVLWERFGVQSLCFVSDGLPWTRISAMVYNCSDDYWRLADAVLQLKSDETTAGSGLEVHND